MISPKICQRAGIAGSVVAALCCFTPLAVILLGWVGLSAWLGWLDYVLLPALGLFLALTVYGFYAAQRTRAVLAEIRDDEPRAE